VLVAEQLFVSGCQLLISVISVGARLRLGLTRYRTAAAQNFPTRSDREYWLIMSACGLAVVPVAMTGMAHS
jgi:hypothetical protein